MRNADSVDKKDRQLKWCPYVFFLVFPLITLVLLHTAPWQEDNSECKPDRTRPRFEESSANISHSENAVLPRGSIVLPTGSIVFEMKKCTCSADVPLLLYMIVIFEFFVFLCFIAFDPLDHLRRRPNEKREAVENRVQLLAIFDVTYISLLVWELDALVKSDVDCSFAIWFFGILFFGFRSIVIIILNIFIWIPKEQAPTVEL
jgi:hypothetical protein